MKPLCQVLTILLLLVGLLLPHGSETGCRNKTFAAEPAATERTAQSDQGDTTAPTAVECTETAPAIFFPEKSFRFENAVAGQTVTHDFVVQNTGGADLQITRVKTG